MWMYVCQDAGNIPRHTGRTSLKNITNNTTNQITVLILLTSWHDDTTDRHVYV